MPRPKSMLIALFILAAFSLCAACAACAACADDKVEKAEKQREEAGQEIRKFPGPPISFNHYGDMYIRWKGRNQGYLEKDGSESFYRFSFLRGPADGETATEGLEDAVKKSIELALKEKESIDGPIEDVQRVIGGQLLHGKVLRKVNSITEIYVHIKGNQIFTLEFTTALKGRGQAERYFKIIMDSIQWQDPNQRPTSELLKFPGPPISFEYSSDMDLQPLGGPSDGWFLNYAGTGARGFFESRLVLGVNTPKEALDSEVIRIMQSHMGFGHRLHGDIKDVQRSIGGKPLKGKLMSFSWGFDKSGKGGVNSDEEIYIYKKGEKFVSLKFTTNFKSREKAERYYKIIADSIQ